MASPGTDCYTDLQGFSCQSTMEWVIIVVRNKKKWIIAVIYRWTSWQMKVQNCTTHTKLHNRNMHHYLVFLSLYIYIYNYIHTHYTPPQVWIMNFDVKQIFWLIYVLSKLDVKGKTQVSFTTQNWYWTGWLSCFIKKTTNHKITGHKSDNWFHYKMALNIYQIWVWFFLESFRSFFFPQSFSRPAKVLSPLFIWFVFFIQKSTIGKKVFCRKKKQFRRVSDTYLVKKKNPRTLFPPKFRGVHDTFG